MVRTAVAAFPNRGFARRLADHASFAASALAGARRAGSADVVVVETPPLFLAAAGVLYARRLGARLIVNVADLWPDSAIELGLLTSPASIRAARALERFAYRHAAVVTAPTAGIVDALSRRADGPNRTIHIPPFVDRRRFELPAASRRDGALRVLYAGTIGLAHGLETLVEAARIAGPDTVHVTIAGGGAELDAIRKAAAERAPGNVHVLGIVSADRVPQLYAKADVAVVLLRNRSVFEGAVPTKIFEAMAAGRPLVLSAAGEAAALVERYACGVVVPPESPRALAAAFEQIALDHDGRQRLGLAGVRAAAAHDVDRAVDSWQGLLERLDSRALMPQP